MKGQEGARELDLGTGYRRVCFSVHATWYVFSVLYNKKSKMKLQ